MQRRELDVPATPRHGGGEKQPQQPDLQSGGSREGVGNLVSGDKTLMESPERVAALNRPRERGTGISNRGDEGQSQIMRNRQQERASGRGPTTQPEHQPGTTGRPMNRRQPKSAGSLDTGNAGAMSGTSRSVKLTNKGRKKSAA